MSDQPEFEELEQIPWSALAAKANDPWTRVTYMVVAALAILGLGVLAARWLADGGEATVITLPPASAGTVAPAPVNPAVPPVTVAVATAAAPSPASSDSVATTTIAPSVYSEADLKAISPRDESRLAAMRAEWLVQDFFTVDGDDAVGQGLATILGDETIPHLNPTGYSYVEWARAYAIESPDPGKYAVAVAFRTLVMADDGGFARSDVKAVAVTVVVDVDGTMRVVDLPSPVALPQTVAGTVPGGQPAEPSSATEQAALRIAAEAGVDPEIVVVTEDDGVWRFRVEVGDAVGNRWPLVVLQQ